MTEVMIYNHQKFIKTIPGDTKSIAKEVAKQDFSARLTITDVADNLILTTIGNLLDYRSEEHTSELQSRFDLVCRLLLEKKKLITLCCDTPSDEKARDSIDVQ